MVVYLYWNLGRENNPKKEMVMETQCEQHKKQFNQFLIFCQMIGSVKGVNGKDITPEFFQEFTRVRHLFGGEEC